MMRIPHPMRSRRPWQVAGGSVAVVAAALVAPQAASGQGAERPVAVVSMGDSFISGEAGRWRGNANDAGKGDYSGTDRAWRDGDGADPRLVYGASAANGCHRSDTAEIHSADIPGAKSVNLACSGAQTANLLPGGEPFKGERPQLERLATVAEKNRVRMVVVSIGGNDLNISGIIEQCGQDYMLSVPGWTRKCADTQKQQVAAAMEPMEQGVLAVLGRARKVMRQAGYADADYRLVLQGYANPLPPSADYRYAETYDRYSQGGCPFWDSDTDWLRQLGADLGARLRRIAADRGAEFLDLRDALRGHELCSKNTRLATPDAPPAPGAADWVRFADVTLVPGQGPQGAEQESLHPNAYGQRAQGRCLALLHAAKPGHYACAPAGTAAEPIGMELTGLAPLAAG